MITTFASLAARAAGTSEVGANEPMTAARATTIARPDLRNLCSRCDGAGPMSRQAEDWMSTSSASGRELGDTIPGWSRAF
jgi:hypothetical protein